MYSVKGNSVIEGGKTVDTGTSHMDAVRAAQDRARSGNSFAVAATVFSIAALDMPKAPTHTGPAGKVRAVQADRPIKDKGGEAHPPGTWVVKAGKALATVSPEQFEKDYAAIAADHKDAPDSGD